MKKLLAEAMLEQEVTREVLRKKWLSAPARREGVQTMKAGGLSERHSLRIVRMSASSLRYQPALWCWNDLFEVASARRGRQSQTH